MANPVLRKVRGIFDQQLIIWVCLKIRNFQIIPRRADL